MGQTDGGVRELLWQVDGRLEREGWDQPPCLFIVYREPAVAEGVLAEVFMTIPFPGWYELGSSMENPTAFTVLATLTDLISQMPPEEVKPAFADALALVIATEMWMVRQYRETPVADAQQALDEYDGPLPADHPDRVEGRMIVACMADGSSDTLFHERDGIAEISGDDSYRLGGRMIDALAELVEVTIG